jgi:hypothetical protein
MRDVAMKQSECSASKSNRRVWPEAIAVSVTRIEAQRQFRLSFALVIMVTVGMLVGVASMPMGGWERGYSIGHRSQVQP